MFPHPVSAYTYHVLGNVGAASATKARLDAALELEVATQVVVARVGLVAVGPRTFMRTSGRKCRIFVMRGAPLEDVGFVTVLELCTEGLRGRLGVSCNE